MITKEGVSGEREGEADGVSACSGGAGANGCRQELGRERLGPQASHHSGSGRKPQHSHTVVVACIIDLLAIITSHVFLRNHVPSRARYHHCCRHPAFPTMTSTVSYFLNHTLASFAKLTVLEPTIDSKTIFSPAHLVAQGCPPPERSIHTRHRAPWSSTRPKTV